MVGWDWGHNFEFIVDDSVAELLPWSMLGSWMLLQSAIRSGQQVGCPAFLGLNDIACVSASIGCGAESALSNVCMNKTIEAQRHARNKKVKNCFDSYGVQETTAVVAMCSLLFLRCFLPDALNYAK